MQKSDYIKLTLREKKISIMLTISLMLTIFFADLYVPALPAIQKGLNTSKHLLQFSVGFYFFGLSLAQLFFGPLSDRLGRRPVILAGFGIAMVGSFINVFAQHMSVLLIGRFIQSVGMGAPGCLGRIALRDIFDSDVKFARVGSFMGSVVLVAPAIAPIMGAYIQDHYGWRADFIFLMLLNAGAFLVLFFYFPETNENRVHEVRFRETLVKYIHIMSNRVFLGYSLCTAALLSGLITYLAVSSFLFQNKLGFTPIEYSHVSILTTAALVTGMLLNAKAVVRLRLNGAIRVGLILMCLASFTIVMVWITGRLSAFSIIFAVVIYCLSSGFVFSNATSGSFTPFKKDYGVVGALFSSIRTGFASLCAMAAGLIETHAMGVLTIIYVLTTAIAIFSFFVLCERR